MVRREQEKMKRKEEKKKWGKGREEGRGRREKTIPINEQTIKYYVKNKEFLVGKKMHNKDNSSRSLPGDREHPTHRRK